MIFKLLLLILKKWPNKGVSHSPRRAALADALVGPEKGRATMIVEEMKRYQVEEVSALIKRNLQEINSRDYPPSFIALLIDAFSPENINQMLLTQQIFVATENGKVLGTGALANFGNNEEPSYYGVAMFVLPELHRNGIGTQIIRKIEAKAKELGAEKLIIRAAIGARIFYQKVGYNYCDVEQMQDENGNYVMDKTLGS